MMTDTSEIKKFEVDCGQLPSLFPTDRHNADFWEALGRAVATFGFLEQTLGKAIFAITATRKIDPDQFEEEYKSWIPTLEKALSDALGGLIDSYEKAIQSNNNIKTEDLSNLLTSLREVAERRNVICHGSWQPPDGQGRSLPFFVDRKRRVWDTPIDIAHLIQLQQFVAGLVCKVVNTVTLMGYQFPGSNGPGKPIF
jgi:hypothetical protein